MQDGSMASRQEVGTGGMSVDPTGPAPGPLSLVTAPLAPDEAAATIRPGRSFLELDRVDIRLLALLIVLAFALRMLSPVTPGGIGTIATPLTRGSCQTVPPAGKTACGFVFDEVYFPVDALKDLYDLDYFDPEPPLTKLLIAPSIAAFGFNALGWRFTSAVSGSLFVGLLYLIGRRLRRERFLGLTAALFVCLDGLAFVESRTGVIDMIAVLFAGALYYLLLLHWAARTRTQWLSTLYMLAIVGGLALSAKVTALPPLAILAGLSTVRWMHARRFWSMAGIALLVGGTCLALFKPLDGLLAGAVGLLLLLWGERYLYPGWLRLARKTGGKGVGTAGMLWRAAAGRRALLHYAAALVVVGVMFAVTYSRYLTIGHVLYSFTGCTEKAGVMGKSFTTAVPMMTLGAVRLPNPVGGLVNIYWQIWSTFSYQVAECQPHPYASAWYTWPVLLHPVLYYYQSFAGGKVGMVTNMGNPALWWPAIPALLACGWLAFSGRLRWQAGAFLLACASLAVAILSFHAGERPPLVSVRVNVGLGFHLALIGIFVTGALLLFYTAQRGNFVPGFISLGFLVGWIMWAPGNAARVLFLYHMLDALPFMALGLAYILSLMRKADIPWFGSRRLSLAGPAYGMVVLVVVGFLFFYPIWTGIPQTVANENLRVWFQTWLYGSY